jgi:hypothetical protein
VTAHTGAWTRHSIVRREEMTGKGEQRGLTRADTRITRNGRHSIDAIT